VSKRANAKFEALASIRFFRELMNSRYSAASFPTDAVSLSPLQVLSQGESDRLRGQRAPFKPYLRSSSHPFHSSPSLVLLPLKNELHNKAGEALLSVNSLLL